MDTDAGKLGPARRQVRRHPAHLLAPVAVVAAAGGLAATVQTVVHAWTAPTLLRDGTFTFAEDSTAATMTSMVAAALLVVASAAAMSLVGLLAAAHELRRRPSVRAALREVRRRWALVLAGSVLLVAVVVAVVGSVVVLFGALPPEGAVLLFIPALLAVAGVSALVGRVFPVALVHGVGVLEARRLLHAHRRVGAAAQDYRHTVRLTFTALILGTVANWAVGLLPEGLGHPMLDAANSLVQVVTTSLVLAVLAVGTTQAHVNATLLATPIDDRDELVWPVLDRIAPPVADAAPEADPDATSAPGRTTDLPLPSWGQPLRLPTSRDRARRRTAWARTPWTGVAAVWAIAPLALLAVVATNPTLAIEPVATRVRTTLVDPFTVPYGDGVVVASYERITYCTADDGCATQHPFFDFRLSSAVADPAGTGIAITGEDFADRAQREYVLLTCDPLSCDAYAGQPVSRALLAEGSGLGYSYTLATVAAQDGAYAVIYASDDLDVADLTLLRCATAACVSPRTTELGGAQPEDAVRAAFAPDGTLWVLQSTAEQDTVRLRSFAPEATSPVDALTLEVPGGEYGYSYSPAPGEYYRAPMFELAVRDDGTPVVLYRDTTDGTIVLTDCEDAGCASSTSTRLPFDPGTTRSAQLAVDSTGRPLIATSGGGIRLHSCADRACTSMRSGLVSTGFPESLGGYAGAAPFMVLDAHERPVFLSSPQYAHNEVLFCAEARCGL